MLGDDAQISLRSCEGTRRKKWCTFTIAYIWVIYCHRSAWKLPLLLVQVGASPSLHQRKLPQPRRVEAAVSFFHQLPKTSLLPYKFMWRMFYSPRGSDFDSIGRLSVSVRRAKFFNTCMDGSKCVTPVDSCLLPWKYAYSHGCRGQGVWWAFGGLFYFCTLWVGTACQMGRARCGIKVSGGSRAAEKMPECRMEAGSIEAYTTSTGVNHFI